MNRVSGDSLPSNVRPNVSIQTEWSCIQGHIYTDYAEESSKLQYMHMLGDKVSKKFGERTYEGSVEIYNNVTNKFQVTYENGHRDEIEGDDIINYLEHHRNNITAEDAFPRASSQPSEELPCEHPTKDMATADANMEGKGIKRPRVTRLQNAEGSSQPRRARKSTPRRLPRCENVNPIVSVEPPIGVGIEDGHRTRASRMQAQNDDDIRKPRQGGEPKVQSSCGKRQKRETIIQGAPVRQSSDAGTEGRGRYRALRMRAENAGDVNIPSQAGKPRVQSSGSKRQKHEKITRGAPVQQSADVGKEGRGGYKALRIRAENAVKVSKPRKAGKRRGLSSSSKGQKCENITQGAHVHRSSDVGTEKRGKIQGSEDQSRKCLILVDEVDEDSHSED